MKQTVKMLKTQLGVHDGEVYPVVFEEGKEYSIGPDLLESFIGDGVVDLVTPETRETKVIAPEETKPAVAVKKTKKPK